MAGTYGNSWSPGIVLLDTDAPVNTQRRLFACSRNVLITNCFTLFKALTGQMTKPRVRMKKMEVRKAKHCNFEVPCPNRYPTAHAFHRLRSSLCRSPLPTWLYECKCSWEEKRNGSSSRSSKHLQLVFASWE